MADNFGGSENIFYTDDANIVLIDPNSIIDSKGLKKDRVIKQENLVMYANLEVGAVPRTKLSVGESVDKAINNVTIASINFLKPQGKNSFDTSYTDEFTGGRNLQGAVNQRSFDFNNNPQQVNYVDTQVLGIKNISVDIMFNGIPTVSMQLVDVQGRALFETGGNSPYSVFLYYPYPLFKLTLKGFYGKAIQYELMLRSFNASFESSSGNYLIDLQFIARTSAILDDVRLGYLFALPNMYPKYTVPVTTNNNTSQQAVASQNQIGTNTTTVSTKQLNSVGYSKIKQVFDEYRNNGLIDKNVPTLTLEEMGINLSKYTQFLNEQFDKLDFTRVVGLKKYRESISKYKTEISKWQSDYINTEDKIILNDNSVMYGLKQTVTETNTSNSTSIGNNPSVAARANVTLTGITESNKKTINNFPIWGKEINKPENFFKYDLFTRKFTETDINFAKTYEAITPNKFTNANSPQFKNFKRELIEGLKLKGTLPRPASTSTPNPYYYTFEEFEEEIENLNTVIDQKDLQENELLNETFQNKLKSSSNPTNLNFRPTIRNVVGVIMASVDAFYRLMDDVHKQAWNVRNDKQRIKAIINKGIPSQDGKDAVESSQRNNITNIVYPWPQFVQKKEQKGVTEYQVTYPGSKSVVNFTNGYDTRVWPEVEFVEQFLNGVTQKELTYDNENQNSPTIALPYTPLSAIEFAFKNRIYNGENDNPDAIYPVYELYERILLNAYYSGLHYTDTNQTSDLIFAGSDLELSNLKNAGIPEVSDLKKVFKDRLPSESLYDYLKSTGGQNEEGPDWNRFKNQEFITPYLNEKVVNSTEIFSEKNYRKLSRNPIQLESQGKLTNFLSANTSSQTSILDTYPFIIPDFQNRMENPKGKNYYETIYTYGLDSKNLFINNEKTPIIPLSKNTSTKNGFNSTAEKSAINLFFETRYDKPTERYLTEGNFEPSSPGITQKQTTSIFNTPMFMNGVMEAATNTSETQFTKLAFLFLNSLPLSTFYERYLNSSITDTETQKSDYIFASMTKFSAVHKIPYALLLKIGSIWHRYKTYINTNVDILDSIWKDFDYVKAYTNGVGTDDTYQVYTNNDTSTTEPFKLNGTDSLNLGFYPELVKNFYSLFTNQNNFPESLTDASKENLKIVRYNPVSLPTGAINTYYTYFKITDKYLQYFGPSNSNKILVLPSAGYLPFEQAYYQYTNEGVKTKSELNVPQVYNGSARLFWDSPNYGWFDATNLSKPRPDQHLKYIKPLQQDINKQFEFILSTKNPTYSSIEDLFGTFDFSQLEKFEKEFLDFCKKGGKSSIFTGTDDIPSEYANFQELLKKLFIVDVSDIADIKNFSNTHATSMSSEINKFLNINVHLKIGNPKQFDRIQFGNFISASTSSVLAMKPVSTITYGEYVKNTLPGAGQTVTLQESKDNNEEAWKALNLYIGPSTIPNLGFGNTSYIYDFFIDNNIEFTAQNVERLHKLIKIYATQKYLKGSYDSNTFKNDITNILQNVYNKRTNIELQVRGKLNTVLTEGTAAESPKKSTFDGDSSKLEMWEVFKAINDKWVAGINFSETGPDRKVLFEEFLFFDRSNRDIGDDFIINVESIRKYCVWENSNTSVMSLIRQLLSENRMNFFVMPAYINFYGKPSRQSTTRNQTILNNANDTFSTFGYVDYTDSGPKFLCQYIGKPSETLSMDNDPKYPFNSDSFDMGTTAGNPLRNTITPASNKQFQNNKAVGFIVDFGTVNQSVFKSVEIAQNQNVTSSEQIQTIVDMGRSGGNKKTMQQSTSLFELYKNRTYDCTLKTFGNVMLQPTMYFVLRHMPMFNGTYVIRSVKHNIGPGVFNTEVRGQRLSKFTNVNVTDELASINQDFTKKLNDKVRNLTDNNQVVTFNSESGQYVTGQESKDIGISGRTPYQGLISTSVDTELQACQTSLWGAINTPPSEQSKLSGKTFNENTNFTRDELFRLLKGNVKDKNMRLFLWALFCLSNSTSTEKDTSEKTEYTIKQNNLFGATADVKWNEELLRFVDGYRCLNNTSKGVIPFLDFKSPTESILFTNGYFEQLLPTYITSNNTGICLNFQVTGTTTNDINCTAITFIKLWYEKWYTSGPTATTNINENTSEYVGWTNNVKYAITQAILNGLLN
jgi:hypothetical protein